MASRAIEFAIGLTETSDFGTIYCSDILKLITGRLCRNPSVYEHLETPRLKPFLESFMTMDNRFGSGLNDYHMVDVKRVIRCAVAVEDWGFLPHIKKVLAGVRVIRQDLLEEDRYDYAEEVKIEQAEALLNATVRLFEKNS